MRPRQILSFAVLALLLLGTAPPGAGAQEAKSWKGKRIMLKKTGARLWITDEHGEKKEIATLSYTDYLVDGDLFGKLRIRQDGVEGYIDKREAVLLDNAIAFYTNRIRLNEKDSSAYGQRAWARRLKGEPDIALKDHNEAIRLSPDESAFYIGRGVTWADKGEYDKAIRDYTEAIRLNPKDALAYKNRGNAWLDKKEHGKAIADYTEAIRLNPKSALAYYNRGLVWSDKKEYGKAIADYNEAIRIDPKYAWAYNNRAWLWATCPDPRFRDGKKALASAKKACELSKWKSGEHLATLAAAHAELGEFEEAVKWRKKALALPD